MTAQLKVNHVRDTDVDHAQEALIPFLELALVKYLDGNDRGILHEAGLAQWLDT